MSHEQFDELTEEDLANATGGCCRPPCAPPPMPCGGVPGVPPYGMGGGYVLGTIPQGGIGFVPGHGHGHGHGHAHGGHGHRGGRHR